MPYFGPDTNPDENIEFVILAKKRTRFKHNHVNINFPKEWLMKIAGNPKKWLLSFEIDKSVLTDILQNDKISWFDDISKTINFGIFFD